MSAPLAAQEGATLVLGAGASGIWHHNSHVQHTVETVSVEYRSGHELFREVKPLVGAFAMSDGGAYLHAGIYRDFALAPRWIVTPHFSAGAYGRGSKNDLGGTKGKRGRGSALLRFQSIKRFNFHQVADYGVAHYVEGSN